MNRNLLLVGIIFGLLSVGCSSGLDWKGSVKGTFEVQDSKAIIARNHNDPPLVPLETGSGGATLIPDSMTIAGWERTRQLQIAHLH